MADWSGIRQGLSQLGQTKARQGAAWSQGIRGAGQGVAGGLYRLGETLESQKQRDFLSGEAELERGGRQDLATLQSDLRRAETVLGTGEAMRGEWELWAGPGAGPEEWKKSKREYDIFVEGLAKERQADYLRLQAELNAAAREADDEAPYDEEQAFISALSLTLMAFEHGGQFTDGLGWNVEVTPDMVELILAGFGTHVSRFSLDQQTALKSRLSSYLDTISPGWNVEPEPELIPGREPVRVPESEAFNLPDVGALIDMYPPLGEPPGPEVDTPAAKAKRDEIFPIPRTVKGDKDDTTSEAYAWEQISALLSSMQLTSGEETELEGSRGDLRKLLPLKGGITSELPAILKRIRELKSAYGL